MKRGAVCHATINELRVYLRQNQGKNSHGYFKNFYVPNNGKVKIRVVKTFDKGFFDVRVSSQNGGNFVYNDNGGTHSFRCLMEKATVNLFGKKP